MTVLQGTSLGRPTDSLAPPLFPPPPPAPPPFTHAFLRRSPELCDEQAYDSIEYDDMAPVSSVFAVSGLNMIVRWRKDVDPFSCNPIIPTETRGCPYMQAARPAATNPIQIL